MLIPTSYHQNFTKTFRLYPPPNLNLQRFNIKH